MRPVIKRHGGKHYLAKHIIPLFPPHTRYVEPYFGAGAVLMQKPAHWIAGISEIANDLDRELTNFWDVLKSESLYAKFARIIAATPFSQIEFDNAKQLVSDDEVERGVAFFILVRQSRQGLCRNFATSTSRKRSMHEQASSWWAGIDGLDDAHERLKRVVIRNTDAIELIAKEDGPETFFYLDPTYVHETRTSTKAYSHEMTDDDHGELVELIAGIKGRFILSGYPSDFYQQHADRCGWKRIDKLIDNKSSNKKTKELKTESLWMNYDPQDCCGDQPLLF